MKFATSTHQKGAIPRVLAYIGLLSLGGPLASGAVTSLFIANHDFETGGLADNKFSISYSQPVVPVGWTGYNLDSSPPVYFGYFNPNYFYYTGTAGSPGTVGTMDGPNMFYFGSAVAGQGIEQQLADPFDPYSIYTLTVALGARIDGYMTSMTMQILAGDTLVASTDVFNSTLDSVSDFSLVYTPNSSFNSLAGQNLKIRFLESQIEGGDGFEVDMDNVRLTASAPTSVPEPSAALLTGLAAGIGMMVRRRN